MIVRSADCCLSFLFLVLLTFGPVLAEDSVNPGINEKFLDPQLKVEEWLKRFETESREIFTARDAILEACAIKPGDAIADVGAGTGLYTRLLAGRTGERGWVYAVEINSRFLEHIQHQAKEDLRQNIATVLLPVPRIRSPCHRTASTLFSSVIPTITSNFRTRPWHRS